MLAPLLLAWWTVAQADSQSIEQWRSEATRVRVLAENDVPAAYKELAHLEAALPAAAAASDRARLLNIRARVETYLAHSAQAARDAEAALALARDNDDRIGQIEAGLTIVLTSTNQARLDLLMSTTTRTARLLEGVVDRPDLMVEAMHRTAMAYRRMGQFEDSVEVCVHALDVAKRSNNPLALTYAHQCLGLAFEQSYRFEEAKTHFQEMYSQAQRARSKMLAADALGGIASAQMNLGDAAAAEKLFHQRLALCREVGAPFNYLLGLFGLANFLATQGRHDERVAVLSEAMAGYDKHPNPLGLWYALNTRSDSYEKLGRMPEAMADALRASAIAKQIDFPLYLSQSAQRLASLEAAQGNYRGAYEQAVIATEMDAKASRERTSRRMVELAERYEREAKQREIEQLTRRNTQQALVIRQRDLEQRWLWTVLGSSIVVIGIIAVFLIRLRSRHRLLEAVNAQLRQSQAELHRQSEAVRSLNTTLELRVQERTAQLQAAVQELEAFNYSASHDLKSPLRTMSGFSSMLLETHGDKLDAQASKYLRQITLATQRMGQIIDDLLTLSRANRAELRCSNTELSSIATDVAEDLRRGAAGRDIEFIVQPRVLAHCDPNLMRIVLENLLGNAVKFTSRRAHARIEFGVQQVGAEAVYFVRDNGVGFDCQCAARVFKAFERLHSATEFPGSGIGLATVERIIKRHGARIWAEGTPGEGATFYFTLPQAPLEVERAACELDARVASL